MGTFCLKWYENRLCCWWLLNVLVRTFISQMISSFYFSIFYFITFIYKIQSLLVPRVSNQLKALYGWCCVLFWCVTKRKEIVINCWIWRWNVSLVTFSDHFVASLLFQHPFANTRKAFSLLTLNDELLCRVLVCCWKKNKVQFYGERAWLTLWAT